jgi:hypothetical protein
VNYIERAYRRGAHEAFEIAQAIAEKRQTVESIRRGIDRAEQIAADALDHPDHEIDVIERIAKRVAGLNLQLHA